MNWLDRISNEIYKLQAHHFEPKVLMINSKMKDSFENHIRENSFELWGQKVVEKLDENRILISDYNLTIVYSNDFDVTVNVLGKIK